MILQEVQNGFCVNYCFSEVLIKGDKGSFEASNEKKDDLLMASGQIDFVNTQKTFLRESLNLSTIDDQIRAGFIAGYLRSGMVADIIVVFNP